MKFRQLNFFVLILFVGLCSFNLFAQTLVEQTENAAQTETKKAILLDEFGRVGDCDYKARLDNASIEMQNRPDSVLYIIFYQDNDTLPASYNRSPLNYYANYLTQNRRLDASRFVSLSGGFRENMTTEVWLVPNGATPPEPTNTVPAPQIPKNKTFLYGESFLNLYDMETGVDFSKEFLLPTAISEQETVAEVEETENQQIEEAENSSENTQEIETPSISQEEIEEIKFSWINPNFAEAVKNEEKSQGVIVFYADELTHDLSKVRAHLELGIQKMVQSREISSDRFQIMFGGFRYHIELEMWVVPAGKQLPTPKPEERPVDETQVEEAENK